MPSLRWDQWRPQSVEGSEGGHLTATDAVNRSERRGRRRSGADRPRVEELLPCSVALEPAGPARIGSARGSAADLRRLRGERPRFCKDAVPARLLGVSLEPGKSLQQRCGLGAEAQRQQRTRRKGDGQSRRLGGACERDGGGSFRAGSARACMLLLSHRF